MTRFDDLLGEMRLLPTSEDTAARILVGAVDPEDAPPELRQAARVLRAAAAPATEAELAGQGAMVTAMAAVVRGRPGRVAGERRSRPVRRVLLLAAALLVATGGIAAAVGVGSLSEEASEVASEIAKERLAELGVAPELGEALADVASATGKEISELATTTDAEGVEKGAEIASTASRGSSEQGTDVAVDAVAGGAP